MPAALPFIVRALEFRAGLATEMDMVIGAMAILLVLEGTRRSIGPPLPIIAYAVLINFLHFFAVGPSRSSLR